MRLTDDGPVVREDVIALRVEVVTSHLAFAGLEGEWEELRAACPSATPFQSWAWLFSWWEHYGGGPLALRVVAVREEEGGRLAGAAPLMLERRRGLPGRLLFVGTGITDHLDVVARAGLEREVWGALAGALGRMGGWSVADLQQVGPGASAWGLYRAWVGPKAQAWQDGCPVVDLAAQPHHHDEWEGLLSSGSKRFRNNVRRSLRRAEGDGARWERAGPEGAEEAARRLVALHREAWEGRPIGPEHLTRRFEGHLSAAAGRMAARGVGWVSELRRGGEVLASHLLALGPDRVEDYLIGAKSEALKRYSVDALYMHDAVGFARRHGLQRVSAGRGTEAYKMRWRPEVEENRRLLLGRPAAAASSSSWAFWPYAGWRLAYSRARRWANSGEAPGWVGRAAAAHRALQFWIARRAVPVNTSRQPERAAEHPTGGGGYGGND